MSTIESTRTEPRQTNGLAIAGFVLGIVWLFWLGSVLAIVFGHVALHQIKRTGETGRGFAIAALALGYVGIATLALWIVVAVSVTNDVSNQIDDSNRQFANYTECLDRTDIENWDVCDVYLK